MIGRHEVHGPRAQHARTVEAAPVEQHLGEARVVARRRHGTPAAAVELSRHAWIGELVVGAGLGMRRQSLRDARALVGGHEERRVRHLQRPVDALGQDLAERLARDDLDHAPEDIGRQAVFPPRPGLVEQRSLAEPFDELVHGQRQRGLVRGLRIHLVDLRRAAVAVGEARRMPHQILNRHLPLDGRALEPDLLLLEGGDVFRHGVGQQQPAFLVERQRSHRDHRLGHRGDAEDRVGRHRRAGVLVTEADGLQIGDAALAGHQDHGARNAAALDVGAEDLRDAVQTLGREPDLFGLGRRQLRRERAARRDDDEQEREGERAALHDPPPGWRTSAPGAASSSHAFTVIASML